MGEGSGVQQEFAFDEGYEYGGGGGTPAHSGFFVSVLTRYPEIASLKYVPETGCVVFRFMLQGVPARAELREFVRGLRLSLEVYAVLSHHPVHVLRIDHVPCEPFCSVEVTRDVDTLTSGEIALIVGFLRDRFAERLVYEDAEMPEDDDLRMQDAVIAHTLDDVRQMKPCRDLIGYREHGRVVLFGRGEHKP